MPWGIWCGHPAKRKLLPPVRVRYWLNTRAFSLLLCTVKLSEVRLFLRKSHVGSRCSVYTRSENAAAELSFGMRAVLTAGVWVFASDQQQAGRFPRSEVEKIDVQSDGSRSSS